MGERQAPGTRSIAAGQRAGTFRGNSSRMLDDLLRANWQVFEAINQRAGHQSLLDPLMVVGAQDVIFVLPLLLLALWFAVARWAPLGRVAAAARAMSEGGDEGEAVE